MSLGLFIVMLGIFKVSESSNIRDGGYDCNRSYEVIGIRVGEDELFLCCKF